MQGYSFHAYRPDEDRRNRFERLRDIFLELVTHTSGDVEEALDWMRELDNKYRLTSPDYTMEDFVAELRQRGYIRDGSESDGRGRKLGARTRFLATCRRRPRGGMRPGFGGAGMRPRQTGVRMPSAIRWTPSTSAHPCATPSSTLAPTTFASPSATSL